MYLNTHSSDSKMFVLVEKHKGQIEHEQAKKWIMQRFSQTVLSLLGCKWRYIFCLFDEDLG